MRDYGVPLKTIPKTAEGLLEQSYVRVFLPLGFFFFPKEDTYKKLITSLEVWWPITQTDVKTTMILQLYFN